MGVRILVACIGLPLLLAAFAALALTVSAKKRLCK